MIKVDMDDRHSCRDAIKGAYGVYLVTNYWEIHDAEREIAQVGILRSENWHQKRLRNRCTSAPNGR